MDEHKDPKVKTGGKTEEMFLTKGSVMVNEKHTAEQKGKLKELLFEIRALVFIRWKATWSLH